MKNWKIAALLVTAVIGLAGCSKAEEQQETTQPSAVQTETEEVIVGEVETVAGNESDRIGSDRSYLTGQVVGTEIHNSRPFAVMLNNIINACPQAGIDEAGIVYEAPVEGSLTRLMAIFEDISDMEKIGSVRSCRTYYPMYAMEYDAIYVHFGQAVYAFDLLNSDEVDNISGLASQPQAGDINGYAGEGVFYRTSDRSAPHNCYTNTEGLEDACETLGYSRSYDDDHESKFLFAEDGETITLGDGEATKVTPGYLVNKPWFEYRDGVYYRYQYDDAQIDQLTGDQLSYTNIILQVSEWENYDKNGYLNIDTMSGGDAYYITNGTYEKCTWKRADESEPTRYYDVDGEEIVLNQGKTWICIIQDSYEENIVIE